MAPLNRSALGRVVYISRDKERESTQANPRTQLDLQWENTNRIGARGETLARTMTITVGVDLGFSWGVSFCFSVI